MNYPERTDDQDGREGWNQNPNAFAGSSREDFNGKANDRILRRSDNDGPIEISPSDQNPDSPQPRNRNRKSSVATVMVARTLTSQSQSPSQRHVTNSAGGIVMGSGGTNHGSEEEDGFFAKARNILVTFGKFVGPGFMVSQTFPLHCL